MQADIEKEIRNIIEYHCGGTYPSRQKATKLILQIYKDQRLHVRIYKYLKNIIKLTLINMSFKIKRIQAIILNKLKPNKPKQFLCGNEYRNKEKRCIKQCDNCQGNV